MRKVFAICGSSRENSSNSKIIQTIKNLYFDNVEIEIYPSITILPHFNPDLDNEKNLPKEVKVFRQKVLISDGVLICTPEYVFSIPGSLKNAIEWTVGSTVFSGKPLALITASGLGGKAHEELLLIMKTIYGKFTKETQLLISGARSKVDGGGISDTNTLEAIKKLMNSFLHLIN